jgi:hypothetical protein
MHMVEFRCGFRCPEEAAGETREFSSRHGSGQWPTARLKVTFRRGRRSPVSSGAASVGDGWSNELALQAGCER